MSPRERDTLRVIKQFIDKYGYSPSVREICDKLGLLSPSTVWIKLKALKQKGYIDYVDGKNRTIRVIKYDNEI